MTIRPVENTLLNVSCVTYRLDDIFKYVIHMFKADRNSYKTRGNAYFVSFNVTKFGMSGACGM